MRRECASRAAGRTGAELLGRDGAITVLVEEGEGLLELSDLLLGKLLVTRPAGIRARGPRISQQKIERGKCARGRSAATRALHQ
jgi:hypothetical protein